MRRLRSPGKGRSPVTRVGSNERLVSLLRAARQHSCGRCEIVRSRFLPPRRGDHVGHGLVCPGSGARPPRAGTRNKRCTHRLGPRSRPPPRDITLTEPPTCCRVPLAPPAPGHHGSGTMQADRDTLARRRRAITVTRRFRAHGGKSPTGVALIKWTKGAFGGGNR